MKIFSSFLRMQYRQDRTSAKAGSTIQIDSYSVMHFSPLSSSPSLSLFLASICILPSFFLRQCNIAPSSSSYETDTVSLSLPVYHSLLSPLPYYPSISFCIAVERQPRKQSYKALMFRATTVKHFNLSNAIASDRELRASLPSLPAMWRMKFRLNFLEMSNVRMESLPMGASTYMYTRKRETPRRAGK